ncbi:MAG TPA: hypothetical protein PKU96_00375 [bacterium]|nr:hypothetical protein [Myxococcales bacterium]OQA60234.1 MAG: hypothetical protein BWY40_01043 [bacterium ADurb.Bin270]HPW44813.1 hypothetical protein [bacterium]HQG13710.1 hypothetical protein [bacterium]HQH80117.1 hypothetical protein [bacterium]
MKRILMMVAVFILSVTFYSHAFCAKINKVQVNGGVPIQGYGLVIDASYDPRLDNLVPGYKLINVVIANSSFNIIGLDPQRDKWSIKVDGKSSPIKALHNLRGQDPKAWSALPPRVKDVIGYPLLLPIGARDVIDLFVPETLDLEKFTTVEIFLKSMNTKFEVMAGR